MSHHKIDIMTCDGCGAQEKDTNTPKGWVRVISSGYNAPDNRDWCASCFRNAVLAVVEKAPK